MSEAFLKALKWYILVLFAVIGTSAFMIMDKSGSIRPLMVGILSYGVVYIMSYFWKEFRRKLLFMSIMVFLGLTGVAAYMPDILYIFFGVDPLSFDMEDSYDIYYLWAGTMMIGIFPMMFIFHKYD